jgi:hypothetical protein
MDEIRKLYAGGDSRAMIAHHLLERGIKISPATIYYHLGLRKPKKSGVKKYDDYVRDDCKRRGIPYRNPRSRTNKLWS